jgi:hypothetical protein
MVTVSVQYGDGVPNLNGGLDAERSPDDISIQLKLLADGQQTVLRDRDDRRYNVALRQAADGQVEYVDGGFWGKRVVKHLQVQVLGPAT